MENEFSPTIIEDPVLFDGCHSIQELVIDIENGFKIFEETCQLAKTNPGPNKAVAFSEIMRTIFEDPRAAQAIFCNILKELNSFSDLFNRSFDNYSCSSRN